MYLSRFAAKNYKCLGEIDIPLTPIHVLIGQNDSGKTSLMEAIAALYGSLKLPVEKLFPQPWHGNQLVSFGSAEPMIEFCGQWFPGTTDNSLPSNFKGISYGLHVQFPTSGDGVSNLTRWMSSDGDGLLGFQNADDHYPIAPDSPLRLSSLAISSNETKAASKILKQQRERQRGEALKILADFLKPIEKYSLDPRAMKKPAPLDPERKFRLDHDGFGLPTLLDDILGFDSGLFQKIRAEFCNYFPQFTNIRLKTEGLSFDNGNSGMQPSHEQAGKGVYLVSREQEVRAQQASDGAILFLGILALAHLPEPPPLLLIEEPENGIYPKRLDEIVRLLKQLVERTDGRPFPQIILSTHSPYVVSFFEPEEVTFLSRIPDKPDAPVRARPMRDAPNIHELMGKDEFYLGELWYNLDEKELFHGA